MDARWTARSPNQQNGNDKRLMILMEDRFGGILDKRLEYSFIELFYIGQIYAPLMHLHRWMTLCY